MKAVKKNSYQGLESASDAEKQEIFAEFISMFVKPKEELEKREKEVLMYKINLATMGKKILIQNSL